jgi:hypothetical protein
MIHSDEDDEFDRILRENQMKGQPYHYEKREWVGLTDDEIWEVYKKYDSMQYTAFSKAIEAKLKEKNT